MTKITFLHGVNDRHQAIAGWLAQAYREGTRVVVYVPSENDMERLDRLLWMEPATSFTPHCQGNSTLASETPVVLAAVLDKPDHDECLINLSDGIPPGFSRFEQLIEFVSTTDSDKISGRERYRFYRERGYPLEAQEFSGAAV